MPSVIDEKRWSDALDDSLAPWERIVCCDHDEIEDAFTGELRFGTGGIRALMGVGPNRMNLLTIGKAAQGLANWLQKQPGKKTVAIGFDTRIHSREFAEMTARTFAANGVKALLFKHPQPTPVLDFAIRSLGCLAGVVITASHNPREYNGFKVYGSDGVQATDSTAHAIQAEIELVDPFDVKPVEMRDGLADGSIAWIDKGLLKEYRRNVLDQKLGVDCENLSVVYSPLNGTGLSHAQAILTELGIQYSLVKGQSMPDGEFPECPRPNPENPEAMAAGMSQLDVEGADLFLATDPDADRVGVACMDGGLPRLLTGDEVGLLLFDYLCRQLPVDSKRRVAVTTIVSSPLADVVASTNNVEIRRTLTGFKYIGEQIGEIESQGERFLFGFEESCGYLRGPYVRDKDGICGLMLVCELAAYYKSKKLTLVDALEDMYGRYGFVQGRQLTQSFSGLAGIAYTDRLLGSLRATSPALIADVCVEKTIDYLNGAAMPVVGSDSNQFLPPSNVLEWRLVDGSRILIRPSGTEPKLKAYVFARGSTENESIRRLDALCDEVAKMTKGDYAYTTERRRVIHVILLSGGSGTRLWPLSNSSRSKQFLKVLRDATGNHVSMVQRVFSQIDAVDADIDITIATSAVQVEALSMQVGGRYRLSVEPERRNTAPAIMLACAHLSLVQGAGDEDPVIVMPIDTYADQEYYDKVPEVAKAIALGVSDLVLLGVEPTYPSEKYGYVIPSSTKGDVWSVETFREKPDEATAATYIARGGLWNCGVFGFRLGWLRKLTKRYVDVESFDEYVAHYRELPKNSFDYEVVERAESISVVPYVGTWKDLGTWNTLAEEMAEASSGPVWLDKRTIENVHAVNELGLPLVVAGVSDAMVVATPDGILVTGKDASSHIKEIVEEASLARPMYERHPWGERRVLRASDGVVTSELLIVAGEQLPYVCRRNGVLTWVVTDGDGEVVVDGNVRVIDVGNSITVELGQNCAMRANTDLTIVEIVTGMRSDEEDVERVGYFWDVEEQQ